LAVNAARYTAENDRIILRWYQDDYHAYFEVEDTGIGIEPQYIPRLTERFYRVDQSRSLDTGGTGLGLAIVKHVLIRHRAELRIRSAPNQGSVFTCVFPKSAAVQVSGKE
jgi:two-component system phosphate regulon sensor histidine kinase PhoR